MAEIIRLKPQRPCPICGKPSAQAFHPFCSARCQDVDLNRWLSGRYVIPSPDGSADGTTAEVPGESDEDES